MALTRLAGLSDLNMPLPTKTPCAPRWRMSAASAGGGHVVGGKIGNRYFSVFVHIFLPTHKELPVLWPDGRVHLHAWQQDGGCRPGSVSCARPPGQYFPVPVLTQNTLYLFLSGGYVIRHVKMRKIYREKREIVLHELKNSSNLTLDGIQAGLNAVLVYNGKRKEEQLCLLAPKGSVFIYGMSTYCVGREKLKKPLFVLRFSGRSKEKIQNGMRELKEA